MKTFAALAALAIAATVAAPASATTAKEVRVSIVGKNSVQIENEIKAAANSVCAADQKIAAQDCIDGALMSAHRQLASIMRVRDTGKTPATETVSVVRISLKGKTRDQLHAEIRAAAATVCKAQPRFSVVTYQACVIDTVRAAKAQLQARMGAAA
ncbi:UrcA family protein [Caulobacter sp. 1776]|uniref:UrcA family protein n=1 Tax=Caulobacter sp. 1776 TaxID=3156420 RepID=UPI0033968632